MGDVVNGICRGEYVLVLGSDVMLNACEATGNCGDPHRYMLEKVRETMKSRMGIQYPPAESFAEFISKYGLNSRDVRRWLLDEIADNDYDYDYFNPDLVRLLETKCFRLVLTTTFDPGVEKLMEKVWGAGEFRVMNIFNSRDDNFDFKTGENLGDEYFDIKPTLYYVFGKAVPDTDRNFVLDDNDTMDCISRWLGSDMPKNLMQYIDKKKLLVLGCNLKDWCFRFFWYAMRHKNSSKLNYGDIAVLLEYEKSEQDRNLYNYLNQTIKVRLQTDARKYISVLADALDEKLLLETAVKNSLRGGVFISYDNRDFALAWNVFTRLREAGINVWLDTEKLSVSDEFPPRIDAAIEESKCFVALMTTNVANELRNDTPKFFRREWERAAGENSREYFFLIVTNDYNIREPYHQLVPPKMRESTIFDWQKEPFSTLIYKIESAL